MKEQDDLPAMQTESCDTQSPALPAFRYPNLPDHDEREIRSVNRVQTIYTNKTQPDSLSTWKTPRDAMCTYTMLILLLPVDQQAAYVGIREYTLAD
jgi:hypothetical protein